MKGHFNLLVVHVLMSWLLWGCCGSPVHVQCIPLCEEDIDTDVLEEHGEHYQKRGSNFVDAGLFQPEPGETYQHYQFRVTNTILTQERDIKALMQAIEEKTKNLNHLEKQLSELQARHVDMRLALAALEKKNRLQNDMTLFSRYIVKEGDTLQKIAHQRYGTHTGWLNIYRFNYQSLPYGPNKIEKGQVLLIPNEISPTKKS